MPRAAARRRSDQSIIRRARYAGLGALVVAAVVPGGAQAAPEVPKGTLVTLIDNAPAGEFCSFPITVTAVDATKQHNTKGTVVAAGPLSVTVTNLATGESQTFNASGPTLIDRSTGAFVSVGPTLIG